MRILFTHPHFWPHVRRGAEREIHGLGTRLVARGHRVHLVTSQPRGIVSRAEFGGMTVRYVRMPRPQALETRGVSDVGEFAALSLPFIALARADLVHAWHYGDAWAAIRTRRVRKRPVVLKLTGTVVPELMAQVRFDRRLFREAVRGADEVWCNSQFARDQMADFGVPMEIVPAGVDLEVFRPRGRRSSRPTVVCTASPEEPRKRLVDLLDAWPRVEAAVPDARLLIAGQVSDDATRDLRERLGAAASSVEFAGSLDDRGLVEAYNSAHVSVAPAVHEALGLATLESLACGTPVAGADSGATRELLNPATGTLFAPGNPEACAAAIIGLLGRAGEPGLGEQCRGAAEPYAWPAVLNLAESRYEALLRR